MSTTAKDQEWLGRRQAELETSSLDNIIFVVAGKLGLEAIEDKILILLDKYKSGYECKDCNETGIFISCECERKHMPGRYISGNINRECRFCRGNYEEQRGKKCPTCKGIGNTVIIPDTSQAIPTSGVIVSVGPKCKNRKIAERVLFGSHTGYFLPFKGNAKIRCMREDEPLCKLHSIDATQTIGDFLLDEDTAEPPNR
jgi:hypothetical protein